MPMPETAKDWAMPRDAVRCEGLARNRGRRYTGSPHVFSDDAYIQYDAPQVATVDTTHLTLTLTDCAGRRGLVCGTSAEF